MAPALLIPPWTVEAFQTLILVVTMLKTDQPNLKVTMLFVVVVTVLHLDQCLFQEMPSRKNLLLFQTLSDDQTAQHLATKDGHSTIHLSDKLCLSHRVERSAFCAQHVTRPSVIRERSKSITAQYISR